MDVKRAVYDFVSQGNDLFHLLRSGGNYLDEAELTMLNSQLHTLKIEISMIRRLKRYQARKNDTSSGVMLPSAEAPVKKKSSSGSKPEVQVVRDGKPADKP